jgi:hypothetical protein
MRGFTHNHLRYVCWHDKSAFVILAFVELAALHVCMYVCMCKHVYVYMYVCMCMHVYGMTWQYERIHKHKHTRVHPYTHRHTFCEADHTLSACEGAFQQLQLGVLGALAVTSVCAVCAAV